MISSELSLHYSNWYLQKPRDQIWTWSMSFVDAFARRGPRSFCDGARTELLVCGCCYPLEIQGTWRHLGTKLLLADVYSVQCTVSVPVQGLHNSVFRSVSIHWMKPEIFLFLLLNFPTLCSIINHRNLTVLARGLAAAVRNGELKSLSTGSKQKILCSLPIHWVFMGASGS